MNHLLRREFIRQSAMAGSALLLPTKLLAANLITGDSTDNEELKVYIFSKHLQFLNYSDMSEVAKEMGFDGVDITVRPKGHVLPEKVEEDLPKATEAMKSFGLLPNMLSTNVIDADDLVQRNVLKTACDLGYQFYRPAWIRYQDGQDILETAAYAKKKLAELTDLNKELGISASYHNHSGFFFGGGIWDLHMALKDLAPRYMGCQYDILHATVEGGKNWEIGFNLIKSHINTIVVKDFVWKRKAKQWKPHYTPLGEGMVNMERFFSLLKKNKINVPLSIHIEYDLGGAEKGKNPQMEHKEIFKRIKKDLDYIRRTWEVTD